MLEPAWTRDGGRISADDDATLIGRVRAGDTDAYAVLVRRHAPMAMRTAALLGAGSDAEDAVQEALVKAFRSLDSFRTDRPFRPWLLRIVANEARNAHRSVRRAGREERDARGPARLVDPRRGRRPPGQGGAAGRGRPAARPLSGSGLPLPARARRGDHGRLSACPGAP